MKIVKDMKRLINIVLAALAAAAVLASCSKYDDTQLRESIEGLTDRVEALESFAEGIQGDITSLQDVLNKAQEGVTVTKVETTAEGWVIYFSDGTTATLRNGEDGAQGGTGDKGNQGDKGNPGESGDAAVPSITIIEDEDGNTFWGYVNEAGESVPFEDENGNPLSTKVDVPEISISEDGYWQVSYDGGQTWTPFDVQAVGDGLSFFKNVTEDQKYYYLELSSGYVLKLLKAYPNPMIMDEDGIPIWDAVKFARGETRIFLLADSTTTYTITKPSGWAVDLVGREITITAPSIENTFAELSGEISLLLSIDGFSGTASIQVYTTESAGEEPTELAVGDYYYSDGTRSATLDESKTVIGVVCWVGDPTLQDEKLAADHPDCTNGLVIALKNNVEYAVWTAEGSTAVSDWINANYTDFQYCDAKDTYETDNYLDAMVGYANTCALKAYNAANPGKEVLAVSELENYEANLPTPETCSGWFLPSVGDLTPFMLNSDSYNTISSAVEAKGELPQYLWCSSYNLTSEKPYYVSTAGRYTYPANLTNHYCAILAF